MDALRKDGENDYTLETTSVWVTVGNISVHVIRTDEGVHVDLYRDGEEMESPLSSTHACFAEVEEAKVES